MLKIIKHINLNRREELPKYPQSYLIQTVPIEEIRLVELAEYKKDNCIEVEFSEELAHVIRKVY